MLTCSTDRPWGVHPILRSDEDCPRCGWTAPGPVGDAQSEALAVAAEGLARAAGLGWRVHEGGGGALAA
jgi:hypothetical protein